jgi:hypothetical protein
MEIGVPLAYATNHQRIPINKSKKMKKGMILLALAMMLGTATKAQITLETLYPGSATMTHLAVSGDKYFMMNYYGLQCEIYNLDHTLWKTIDLDVPTDMYLYDIKYVTENLFDLDNLVELAYIYYHYDTTLLFYTYYTRIIKENGSELLSIPGCSYIEVKETTAKKAKLFAYIYDYSVIPYTMETGVYGLPGSLLTTPDNSEMPSADAGSPFPNPAENMVIIPYLMPESSNGGTLVLMNQSGQILQEYRLNPGTSQIQIRTDAYPTGLVFYKIVIPRHPVANGKIMIR